MKIKNPEGGMWKRNPSMVDNLKRKQSKTVGQGSPVSSMNKNVKTSVEIEPEPGNFAEKEKQVTEKPRRKKEYSNVHKD